MKSSLQPGQHVGNRTQHKRRRHAQATCLLLGIAPNLHAAGTRRRRDRPTRHRHRRASGGAAWGTGRAQADTRFHGDHRDGRHPRTLIDLMFVRDSYVLNLYGNIPSLFYYTVHFHLSQRASRTLVLLGSRRFISKINGLGRKLQTRSSSVAVFSGNSSCRSRQFPVEETTHSTRTRSEEKSSRGRPYNGLWTRRKFESSSRTRRNLQHHQLSCGWLYSL